MYYALSAYGIVSDDLEISLIISELIKDCIIERSGRLYELGDKHYINSRNVAPCLEIAGLTVMDHYYYRWCIETIEDTDA